MTTIRAVFVVLLLLAVEAAGFAVWYRDLLFLGASVDGVAESRVEDFRAHATSALARETLTRRHLDLIVANARRHGLLDLELRAATRLHASAPADPDAVLALADVLRRAGQFDAADALYTSLTDRGRERGEP